MMKNYEETLWRIYREDLSHEKIHRLLSHVLQAKSLTYLQAGDNLASQFKVFLGDTEEVLKNIVWLNSHAGEYAQFASTSEGPEEHFGAVTILQATDIKIDWLTLEARIYP